MDVQGPDLPGDQGTTIDSLPDAVLALILDKVPHTKFPGTRHNIMYALVSKRWHRIAKEEVGLVSINLKPRGMGFKLVHQSIRKLLIHIYNSSLHMNYSWITSIAATLEELTIENNEYTPYSCFDLELVSKSCPKLKFVRFYRLCFVPMGKELMYRRKAPLSLTFPALARCSFDNVLGLDLVTELLPACPALEELSANVLGFCGSLSSSSLRVLSLQTPDSEGGLIELDLPNLETACIGDCERLKMRAPRLKKLSLGYCETFVESERVPGVLKLVCNALETLAFRLGALETTVAAMERMHFKAMRLECNGPFCRRSCPHEVAWAVFVLEQFKECQELILSCFGSRCQCGRGFPSEIQELPRLRKSCPALQSIVLFGNEAHHSELQELATCVANIPVTIYTR
ncbi:hypothetical protein SELMODRAFT_416272 [Selaginella moellendorffii]|uniref:F-box domain-containing protein n=1 Tax=Selaginella moellendorffii TaxID=88036 RepID=D8RYR9_SELML|nr:hypothetical protein SELMODRAFT_416272 [Selaginella moellendorffii]